MSYELIKDENYTLDKRANFIVEHQLGHGRTIAETSTAIYALEPNEIMQDGVPIVNPEWDSIQLSNAKKDKIALNDRLRDEALLGGVTYQNVLFDSDTDQKVNLLATLGMLEEGDTIVWYGMDNQGLLCTDADLLEIGRLITELHSY